MAYIGYGLYSDDAYTVMAYIVMASIVMAYIVMAYIVMAYTVMAYTFMAEIEAVLKAHIDMSLRMCIHTPMHRP